MGRGESGDSVTMENLGSEEVDHGAVEGGLDKKDPMRIWLAMKENGFVTPSFGALPSNKVCGKSENDSRNGKVRLANVKRVKRSIKFAARGDGLIEEVEIGKAKACCYVAEQPPKLSGRKRRNEDSTVHQIAKFTKVSPPSGLLNEHKPGIISRIRTSKQVFSVFSSFLRVDKTDDVKCGHECANVSSGNYVEQRNSKDLNVQSQQKGQLDDLQNKVRRMDNEDDKDEVKLAPTLSTISENARSSICSNDAPSITSGDGSIMDTQWLQICPQDVMRRLAGESSIMASHWLEVLCQDVMRRLGALKHSRMRVQNVIQTEIPFLIKKEFSRNQDIELSSAGGSLIPKTAAMHKAKWANLFDKMDKALNVEANQLELWLNQIMEMQSHINEATDTLEGHARQFLQPGLLDSDASFRGF